MPAKCSTPRAITPAAAAKAVGTRRLKKLNWRPLGEASLSGVILVFSAVISRYCNSDPGSERRSLPCPSCLAVRLIASAAARIFLEGMCSGSLFGGSEVLLLGTDRGSLLGAVIWLLQRGHGPLTPANAAGTCSLQWHDLHKKSMVSLVGMISGRSLVSGCLYFIYSKYKVNL